MSASVGISLAGRGRLARVADVMHDLEEAA